MAEVSVKCPACGKVLKAASEVELIKLVKEHAPKHGLQMTDEQIKQQIRGSTGD